MKYAWILHNKNQWPVSLQCEVLEVSPSGYHEHFARRASPRQCKHLSDDALLVHIKAIHAQSKGEYGWPRIWKTLLVKGIPVGKDRVRKLMKLHGIKARSKRKYKATTNSNHSLPIAPNLLGRQFAVAQPNRVWSSDITYIFPFLPGSSFSCRLTRLLPSRRRSYARVIRADLLDINNNASACLSTPILKMSRK